MTNSLQQIDFKGTKTSSMNNRMLTMKQRQTQSVIAILIIMYKAIFRTLLCLEAIMPALTTTSNS